MVERQQQRSSSSSATERSFLIGNNNNGESNNGNYDDDDYEHVIAAVVKGDGGSGSSIISPPPPAAEDNDSLLPTPNEFIPLLKLAAETIVVNIGGTLPNFLVASHVGRYYAVVDLAGFSLASMTSNLCTLSLLSGLLSASDTLSPQAYGAGQKPTVGYIAMRGLIGSVLVLVPTVTVLNLFLERLLVDAFGQDATAAQQAFGWYRVYSLSLPFHAVFGIVWKFLAAQDVMYPIVVCSIVSIGLVLPAALRYSTTYTGTAAAVVGYEMVQAIVLLAWLGLRRPHDPLTWPGLALVWKHALQWRPFATFMMLGAGGMLASSEWIYWEAVCLIAGHLGVIPLSIHTVPTQVLTVYFVVIFSVGTSLAVRLGAALPVSVDRARRIAVQAAGFGGALLAGLVTAMYAYRHAIFHLFTSNLDVLQGLNSIWPIVCFYAIQLGVFSLLMGVCTGLAMQWTLGLTTVVVLWLFGLPTTYYLAVVQDGGILALWQSLWPPYVLINVVLATAIARADWLAIADRVRQQHNVPH